jgi:hypothetical protein
VHISSPLEAALDVGGLCDVGEVPDKVLVELFVFDVVVVSSGVAEENEVPVGLGKDRDVLLLATLQNCWARPSAVPSSWGHPAAMQSTISFVKRLLRDKFSPHIPRFVLQTHLTQKQFTSTTLVQFADALPIAKQFVTK